jgi:hypothetical protein
LRPRQEQSSGADSTNLQAGQDIVHIQVGVTAAEARDIALDVFRSNFLILSGVAEEVARDRAERITREYLEKLQNSNLVALVSVQDPDMLQAIYTAQEGYARSGEEDLERILIDLLVDRSGQQDRDLKTVVLNEAIAVLPKLTARQRATIAICFVVRYTQYTGPLDLDSCFVYIDHNIVPFIELTSDKMADYQHIQSSGVGVIDSYPNRLGNIFSRIFCGFFTNGFTADELPPVAREYLREHEGNSRILVPCLRNSRKLQINSPSLQGITELSAAEGADRGQLVSLSAFGLMHESEIKADLISRLPEMSVLLERWDNTPLEQLELTTVGLAIGHSYWRQITGGSVPLDIWLDSQMLAS